MNYKEAKDYLNNHQLNMIRFKMALKGDVLADKDYVHNLLCARPLRHWEPNITTKLRSWALNKNERY